MNNVVGMNGETKVNEVECELRKGKTLYEELQEETQEAMQVITSCMCTDDDKVLRAVTKGYNNTVWVYNYNRIDGELEINKESCIMTMEMAQSLFNVA